MSWLEAILLGIVQGLTEFLPISSSGHLLVVPQLLGWDDPGAAFTAVTQLGTLAAVIIFFWRELWDIAVTWVRSLYTPRLRGSFDSRLGWYLIIGTVPLVIFGFLFAEQVSTVARNLWLNAIMTIVFGILLWAMDRYSPQRLVETDLNAKSTLAIGFAQVLSLIPGVSRSGITITAARAAGFTRKDAARVSFLLSVPAVAASGIYELKEIGGEGAVAWGPTIVATIVAFVVGYASIAWLLRWLTSHSLTVFAIYRLVLGGLMLVLLATGVVASG